MVISGKDKKMKKLHIVIPVMLLAFGAVFLQTVQAGDTEGVNRPGRGGRRAGGYGGSGRARATVGYERMLERLEKVDPERAEELRRLRAEDPEQFSKKIGEMRTEWILGRIERHNPERAEELRRVRETDPAKFRREVREYFGRRGAGGLRFEEFRRVGYGGKRPGPKRIEGHRGPGGHKGRAVHPRRPRHIPEEFVGWLGDNYPEDANELSLLKERHPRRYGERLGLDMRRWGHIYRAWKRSPELAEVLKDDMELKKERNEVLAEYRGASESEKEALRSQLEEVVSKRFELIVKRKEIRYQELLKELERLQEKVTARKENLQSWKDPGFKRANVKERLEELLSGEEDFTWD